MHIIYHILMLSYRDFLKFIRDGGRIAATFIFPIVFIGIFGVTLDSGLGQANLGFSYADYVFSGILMQTVFQSSFLGIVSLIADREKDFAMSIFVAPVSRYAIVLGKIVGESLVSVAQFVGIIFFGLVIGSEFNVFQLMATLPIGILASFVGASFGVVVASRINNEQNANRVFPFLIFPLIFLSGAFTPVNNLPPILEFLKVINPLYYGVDLMRSVLYMGRPEYSTVVANDPVFNTSVFILLGGLFFFVGTYLFTQKEGNK